MIELVKLDYSKIGHRARMYRWCELQMAGLHLTAEPEAIEEELKRVDSLAISQAKERMHVPGYGS